MVQELVRTLEGRERAEQPPRKLAPCLKTSPSPLCAAAATGREGSARSPSLGCESDHPPASLAFLPQWSQPLPPHPAAQPLNDMTTQNSLVVSIYLEAITKEITTC